MNQNRPIHPDFQHSLDFKSPDKITLFKYVRQFIFALYTDCNKIVYHILALTAVFSISEKLTDAFCMIPIYINHLNLGFNKGNQTC